MKGNNTLLLNESTMVEAVQEYLDSRMHDAPHVTSIVYRPGEYVFAVQVSDAPDEGVLHGAVT